MQTKFEQLLDYLVNEETDKANELFHQIVVEKSRTIYENLIAEEEAKDKDENEDDKEERADENFGMGEESVIEIGGDATDDLVGDVEFGDEGDEMGDDDMGGDEFGADEFGDEGEEGDADARIDDLEDALADLKAEFEQLMGDVDTDGDGDHDMGDHEGEEAGDEFGGDEFGSEEDKDESFIREYTEKVGGATYDKFGKMGDNGANTKSIVAGKNDMGGTAFKLGAGKEGNGGEAGAAGGQLKGNGLLKGSAKEDNAGNINVPGGNAGKTAFKKKEAGHGAEKKGSGETNVNAKSPLNGAPGRAK
jgi:hypothetical protein